MKRVILVVALAVVLVFALTATAFATAAKTWNYQEDYYTWGSFLTDPITGAPGTVTLGDGGDLGSPNANPENPGVHGNYQTTTAKCGICHSVHRANASGVKLLDTSTATCGGCHIAPSTVTNIDIAWGTDAAPLAGPHMSTSGGKNNPGSCTDKACHLTSPHGVGGSGYALFRAKLLTAAVDTNVAIALADTAISGVTTGLLSGAGTDYEYDGDADSTRVGYTCNIAGCHDSTMLSVIATNYAQSRTRPGNTNILKTGHESGDLPVSSTYPVTGMGTMTIAWNPVASCTSCHDQTDAETASGHTFPHAQLPTGDPDGLGAQVYLWYNIAADPTAGKQPMLDANMKSWDGACLKCHREDTGLLDETDPDNPFIIYNGVGWTY